MKKMMTILTKHLLSVLCCLREGFFFILKKVEVLVRRSKAKAHVSSPKGRVQQQYPQSKQESRWDASGRDAIFCNVNASGKMRGGFCQ